MRTVALIVALASLMVAIPPAAAGPADNCANPTPPDRICQKFDVPHGNQPVLSTLPYFDTYYLYVGLGACRTNPFSTECDPRAEEGSGIPLPDNSRSVGLGLFGVLYQETNGAPGLQRERTGTLYLADSTVLV